MRNKRKEIHQVLDFQGFASFRKFSASSPQAFRICVKALIFNASQTSNKCLIFNGFTHLYGAGRVGQW
jgi:hypothetical protein